MAISPQALLSEVCATKEEVLECIKMNIPFSLSPSMEELNLRFHNIGARGLCAVARALKYNRTLQSIGLWGNDIGPEGARVLADSLIVNTGLKEIYLSYNYLGDEGVIELARALAKNTTIKDISLCNNRITDVGAQVFLDALEKHNRTIKWIGIGDNPISEELQNKIKDCAQKNRLVTHRLSGNPGPPPYENFLLGLLPPMLFTTPVMPKIPKLPSILPSNPLFALEEVCNHTRKRKLSSYESS